jgi:membrane protein YqaA with SNARE-associated domain
MRIIRRLYDWVLHWAETPYGQPALFLLAFAEASFFPIPPDVLLIALCLSRTPKSYRFAILTLAGSVLGGMVGYLLGWGVWGVLDQIFYTYVPGFTPEAFARVQDLFKEYGFWTVFTAGFTPIPYKIITIGAGVFHVHFLVFMVASVLSRGLRFFLVASLIFHFGEPVKTFIDRYFNLLSVVFMILLVGGFLLFKGLF